VIHFLAPGFLFGFFLLAVPVIIHLFNFRRYRKVLFTNVRFLQELKEQTTRTSRLKHLLVLISRILAFSFIILAFAQPVIPSGQSTPVSDREPVSIFIDNSFSMDAVSTEGTLLEVARNRARDIARSFPPSTRFQLLTNDFSAVQQRLITRDDFLEEIERVRISPSSRTISEVVLRQREAIFGDNGESARSFMISDFQSSMADFTSVKYDSSFKATLVALPLQETSNLYIDSCWLNSPMVQVNQPSEITVKVVNSGSRDVENVPLRLLINGGQKAVSGLSLAEGESANINFSFTILQPGWQYVELQLTDHPITFDDRYFLSFEVKQQLNILALREAVNDPYIGALFGKDPYFNYSGLQQGNVDYSAFRDQALIVLDDISKLSSGLSEELVKYVSSGGSLCVFPDSSADIDSYNMLFSSLGADVISGVNEGSDKVSSVDTRHPLFASVFDPSRQSQAGAVDFPSAAKYFEVRTDSRSRREVLMKLAGGAPFLSGFSHGEGMLYVCYVPLRSPWSNFAQHAVFVPALYRMAMLGARPLVTSSVIGRSIPPVLRIPPPSGEEVFHLINPVSGVDLIPSVRTVSSGMMINTGDQVTAAGHYQLMRGGDTLAVLSMNYDRRESLMSFMDEDEVTDACTGAGLNDWKLLSADIPDPGKTIMVMNKGVVLWKWAILLALIFLLTETLLLRYWKTT